MNPFFPNFKNHILRTENNIFFFYIKTTATNRNIISKYSTLISKCFNNPRQINNEPTPKPICKAIFISEECLNKKI